jgi:outer membrane protein
LRLHYTFLALLLFARCATAGQALTLSQCLQTGLENNPALQSSRFKTETADRDVKVARADFFPSLSSSYSISRINNISSEGPTDSDYIDKDTRSGIVRLTQILYAGSRINNTHDKAKIIERAIEAEYQLARLELIYNIETTFYKVMKAKQDVISADEAVIRLRENVRAAEAFFQRELVPKVDVLKARVDLADADNELSIAKNNENRQRVALFALMNLPLDPETEFAADEVLVVGERPTFDTSFDTALKQRPDLVSLDLQRQAADKQSAISLGKYLPVVKIDAGYYDLDNDYAEMGTTFTGFFDRDQKNSYWQAGITVSWDLFDGGRSWYESEKYFLEKQRFGALLNEARNVIATGIRKALYSLVEAEQRISGAKDALNAAQENYNAEDNRLRAGVSTITALLDAQSRLVRAQSNEANAILDYRLAQSELRLMTGGQASW